MVRICIIRQYYFPQDPQLRREVVALLNAGHAVDVICLRRGDEPRRERRGELRIHRVPLDHRGTGVRSYLAFYASFLAIATVLVGLLHVRRRYDVIQVNTLPDTLVFAAVVPKLLGVPVLLDLGENMPEFLMTKFGFVAHHPAVRLISLAEQLSIRFADVGITCTNQQRDAFVARGARRTPISVVLNASDEELFDPSRYPARVRPSDEFVLACHGTIEPWYGHDTLVRAVALLKDELPKLRVEIYGEGGYRPELERLIDELDVSDRVRLSERWVPYEELVPALASAHAGVVAMKRDAFRDLTHTNKMYDFITLGTPVLMSRTLSVEAYFDDDSFAWFGAGDEHDLARAIRELHDDSGRGQRLARHAAEVAEPYRWPRQREIYLRTVEGAAAA